MAVIASGPPSEAIIIATPRPCAFHRELRGGNEGDGLRVFAQVVVPGVGNGADDLIRALRILRLRHDMHQLADGLGRADIFPDEGLVDDEDQGRIVSVRVGEAAAGEQRNAHGGKVAGAGVGESASRPRSRRHARCGSSCCRRAGCWWSRQRSECLECCARSSTSCRLNSASFSGLMFSA